MKVSTAYPLLSLMLCAQMASATAAKFSKLLIDAQNNVSIKSWTWSSSDLDTPVRAKVPWSIEKRMLAGGRQEGVEVIEVDNGAMKFTVVTTRGFSVWSLHAGDLRFGWDSPVKEIVHPQFVNLSARGGLGWLDGFGGWMVRCGLESTARPAKMAASF